MTRLLFAHESGPQFDVQASAAEHGVGSFSLPALFTPEEPFLSTWLARPQRADSRGAH
jgi:hypothetical protein